jgi:hypothetical protein
MISFIYNACPCTPGLELHEDGTPYVQGYNTGCSSQGRVVLLLQTNLIRMRRITVAAYILRYPGVHLV